MKKIKQRTPYREAKNNRREYIAWSRMKQRCLDKNHKYYSYYGGRGITICDRWIISFIDFLSDVGKKPTTADSLDRIDNNGNYEPGNVRWATSKEQSLNRRNMKLINGKSLPEISRSLGLSSRAVEERIFKHGWSIEDAVSLKKSTTRRKRNPINKITRSSFRGILLVFLFSWLISCKTNQPCGDYDKWLNKHKTFNK